MGGHIDNRYLKNASSTPMDASHTHPLMKTICIITSTHQNTTHHKTVQVSTVLSIFKYLKNKCTPEMPTISIYFQGGLVWESGRFLSNVYSSMVVASPKIREALKFVQWFTQKSYNFQGAWHLCVHIHTSLQRNLSYYLSVLYLWYFEILLIILIRENFKI